METARIDWLHGIGCEPDPKGEGVVIVNAFCNFHRQFEYPAEVLIRTYVSSPGHSSFESWATMEKVGEPGVLRHRRRTVWVDFPAQVRAAAGVAAPGGSGLSF